MKENDMRDFCGRCDCCVRCDCCDCCKYCCIAQTIPLRGSMGPAGPTGPQGPAGQTGPTGATEQVTYGKQNKAIRKSKKRQNFMFCRFFCTFYGFLCHSANPHFELPL